MESLINDICLAVIIMFLALVGAAVLMLMTGHLKIELVKIEPPFEDDLSRCAVCGWPLRNTVTEGCIRGNCSMRPQPEKCYSEERAKRERDHFTDVMLS